MERAESTLVGGWTARDLILVSVVPLVLTVVAVISTVRYHVLEQSSWRGASFGMFATYEYEYARYVRAVVEGPDGDLAVAIPDDLDELESRALAIPGGPAPQELAERLAERAGAPVRVEIRGHDVQVYDDVEVAVRVIRTVRAP